MKLFKYKNDDVTIITIMLKANINVNKNYFKSEP